MSTYRGPPDLSRCAFGSTLHSGPDLTREQIASLANHVRIVVTWDGGNGPHHYTVRTDLDAWDLHRTPGVVGIDVDLLRSRVTLDQG